MSEIKVQPTYLGDGVYASFDGYQIKLFTDEGIAIYLEPGVLVTLEAYVNKIRLTFDEPNWGKP